MSAIAEVRNASSISLRAFGFNGFASRATSIAFAAAACNRSWTRCGWSILAAVDALSHEPRLRGAGEELGARVDLVGMEVVHRAVRVVDAEARGAIGCRALDRGVHFLGHVGAGALVFDAAHHDLAVCRDAA